MQPNKFTNFSAPVKFHQLYPSHIFVEVIQIGGFFGQYRKRATKVWALDHPSLQVCQRGFQTKYEIFLAMT
jgi:hypothetical protein